MNLQSKLQHLTALRPLSPESVASLAVAWDVWMVPSSNQFPDLRKLINLILKDTFRRHIPINFLTSGN